MKKLVKLGAEGSKKRFQKIYENGDWDKYSGAMRRKKVLEEQNGKCLLCDINEWNYLPVKLHLDHIDGDRYNNFRENLRMICPNCHSQTDTYCANNISKNIPDETIKKCLIKNDGNIVQTLKDLRLAYSSGNWYMVKRNLLELQV